MENCFGILERNYKIRGGELDIIAQKDGVVVFVEVKYQKDICVCYPEERVSRSKIRSLGRAVQVYMQEHPEFESCRFDIIAMTGDLAGKVEIHHIENAFEAGF
ncbi:MAG: YraN family protein [Planctomycetes bacterium]|nr:YraN family protein [Planctomycetota bacterium]